MFRTLHVDTGREMRGGQWQVFHLLRGLNEAGHAPKLLAPEKSPLLEAARALRIDAAPLTLSRLIKLSRGADLVHAHDAHAHTLAAFTSKPLIVARRVAFPVRGTVLSRWKYSRPRLFIAVSRYVQYTLIDAHVPPEHIEIVYDGVPVPPEPDPSGRSQVIALDSDDPGKGRDLLERAAHLARIPVSFTTNLARDITKAKLFVYITDLEGLGSAALVAMAAGAPVLASKVGGLPEIVEDGCTGLLTENSPEEICTALERLLADPELLVYFGRRGRARVEERFTTAHMVQQTIQAYEKVLG